MFFFSSEGGKEEEKGVGRLTYRKCVACRVGGHSDNKVNQIKACMVWVWVRMVSARARVSK